MAHNIIFFGASKVMSLVNGCPLEVTLSDATFSVEPKTLQEPNRYRSAVPAGMLIKQFVYIKFVLRSVCLLVVGHSLRLICGLILGIVRISIHV